MQSNFFNKKVGHPSIELKNDRCAGEKRARVASIHTARQCKPQFIILKAIKRAAIICVPCGNKIEFMNL